MKKLALALKLDPVPLTWPASAEPNHISSFRSSLNGGGSPCRARGFSLADVSSVYLSKSRDAHMRAATNSSMEYFAVVQKRGTKEVCVEMSYAYG